MRQRRFETLASISLLLLAPATLLAVAPRSVRAEILNPRQSVAWTDPDAMQGVEDVASGLRQELQQARKALDRKGYPAARTQLWKVHEQSNGLIRAPAMLPLTSAQAHAAAGDWDALHQDLLPLLGEASAIRGFAPKTAARLKDELQSAEAATRNGRPDEANRYLRSADRRLTAITSYLPLHYLDGQVYAAVDALRRNPVQRETASQNVANALEAVSDFNHDTPRGQG